MKRTAAVFLTICVVLSLLSACGGSTAGGADAQVQLKNLSATVQLSELPNTKSGYNNPASEGTVYYEEEIIQILKGATLLAGGGGGSYSLGMGILDSFKEKNPDVPVKIKVYDVNSMGDGESTFGVGIMGSPTAHAPVSELAEVALYSYRETLELAKRYQKDPQYAIALELGGANTLIPLLCAMKYDLKVLDADLCGRAVPGLDTAMSAVNGLPTSPFALTDGDGNSYDINMANANDAEGVECVAVAILNQLETNGGFTGFYFSQKEVQDCIPTSSLSRCLRIGQVIEEFQSMTIAERRENPLFDMLNNTEDLISAVTLTKEASPVQNFHQESAAGGARDKGYYYLGNEGEAGNYFFIQFNNETMAVSVLNEENGFDCIATAPCIITMYDEATGLPLTNADIKGAVDNGEGDELHVMLGIVETDEKWWNDIDAVTAAWQPYWVEAGYEGELVCYPF